MGYPGLPSLPELGSSADFQNFNDEVLGLLSGIFSRSNNFVAIKDADGRYLWLNEKSEKVLGVTAAQARGKLPGDILPRQIAEQCSHFDDLVVQTMDHLTVEQTFTMKTGQIVLLAEKFPVCDDAGKIAAIVSIGADITERKQREQSLEYLANYDNLTDLPTHRYAMRQFEMMIEKNKDDTSRVAVISVYLGDLRSTTQDRPTKIGQQLLIQCAWRLQGNLRETEILTQCGPEEFHILLGAVTDEKDAETLASSILRAFAQPITLPESAIFVTPHIGIAVYPDDGTSAEDLCRNADFACQVIKEQGVARTCRFSEDIRIRHERRATIRNQIARAIENEEFRLEYQPIVCISGTPKVIAAEALLRWENPILGQVSPDEFIGIAEECGAINDVGHWVLRRASKDAMIFNAILERTLDISVNVSPTQLLHDKYVERVKDAVADVGFARGQIRLEMTENSLVHNVDHCQAVLARLKVAGFRLALDDFGTGYSSLSYLQRFPFDYLKIDKKFVQEMLVSQKNLDLVHNIINLGKSLGMEIVAEGIETESQLAILQECGCKLFQGFLFSRPLPSDGFLDYCMDMSEHEAA